MKNIDVRQYNREAWNRQVEYKNKWTVPVTEEIIAAAREGRWEIYLTPTKPIPRKWFPELSGRDVLCLASGGGQQGPILAAAGARVTVLDNSPNQLDNDRLVAQRDGLKIQTIEGDAADLSVFQDESIDLIIHPVSNNFFPVIRPVWLEAFRVLRPGGALLAGMDNPAVYIFDYRQREQGKLVVKYSLPYSDLESLSDEEKKALLKPDVPLEFSHTLDDQIGGQIDAGFIITGFYEDYTDDLNDPIRKVMPSFMATRAIKLG